MSCSTPKVPPSNATEAAEFAKEFGKQTSNFIDTLELPSPLDSSVLAYKFKSGPYYAKELEDSNIVQPFVQDSVEEVVRGITITVDTTAIISDVVNIVNSLVCGAKVTPTFGGLSITSYRGTVFERDAIFKVILAVYIADASGLYDYEPGSVLELAYYILMDGGFSPSLELLVVAGKSKSKQFRPRSFTGGLMSSVSGIMCGLDFLVFCINAFK
ncbi:hypothetical protein Clacol_000921 [Clathrus columnatus]|uniref:Uncharacterized protein n=1 Tax=Clathrus columnatus TaxID=1419009 RepID=A0AAV5A152_9AGAM|nr:hypothetical protein Clacol_000921 [Clathrus columnatus]